MIVKRMIQGCLVMSVLASFSALAGNDTSIKGELRSDIQQSMNTFIKSHSVNGKVFLYDAVKGKLLKLSLDSLHSGIVKKGDFYVSCADFVDQNDRKIDVDFLVMPGNDGVVATQAIIHSIDGDKRKYHLENI